MDLRKLCSTVFVFGLSRFAYQEAVVTCLVECCSFFCITFGYICDPLHNLNIARIWLFRVKQWSTRAMSVECLKLAIKPPEHRLDVALLPLLVTLDSFHALYWCSIFDIWTDSCLGVHFNFWFSSAQSLV